MSTLQCRMITKQGSPCKRVPELGGAGFCWQHIPVKDIDEKDKWEKRIKIGSLVASATTVIIKLVELAVEHIPVLFSSGSGHDYDAQSEAKSEILDELDLVLVPRPKDSYVVTDEVDWLTLKDILFEAKKLHNQPAREPTNQIHELEAKFDAWFNSLHQYHKKQLLSVVEDVSISKKM